MLLLYLLLLLRVLASRLRISSLSTPKMIGLSLREDFCWLLLPFFPLLVHGVRVVRGSAAGFFVQGDGGRVVAIIFGGVCGFGGACVHGFLGVYGVVGLRRREREGDEEGLVLGK